MPIGVDNATYFYLACLCQSFSINEQDIRIRYYEDESKKMVEGLMRYLVTAYSDDLSCDNTIIQRLGCSGDAVRYDDEYAIRRKANSHFGEVVMLLSTPSFWRSFLVSGLNFIEDRAVRSMLVKHAEQYIADCSLILSDSNKKGEWKKNLAEHWDELSRYNSQQKIYLKALTGITLDDVDKEMVRCYRETWHSFIRDNLSSSSESPQLDGLGVCAQFRGHSGMKADAMWWLVMIFHKRFSPFCRVSSYHF